MSDPAYHKPVLLQEAIDGLNINPDGTYVDATFGGGGHSRAILNNLSKKGRLFVFDQDTASVDNLPDDDRVCFIHSNFRYLQRMLRVESINRVDGILADIGVSSHQFDEAERGFSYRFNGDLDMRMNQDLAVNAAQVVMTYDETALTELFSRYGEVRNAKTLAKRIVEVRKVKPVNTIEDFLFLIDPEIRGHRMKYLSQVFQALRIEVNDEINALVDLINDSVEVLKPGGRLAIITFHSIEDRVVKNMMKSGNMSGEVNKDFYGHIERPFDVITKKPIEPSVSEVKANRRARSAKLRVAEKL